MRVLFIALSLISLSAFAEKNTFSTGPHLTLDGAILIAQSVQIAAKKLNKTVTIAVVGDQGETILIYRGDGVGPHNTEAARRKAYTSLSTKTATLLLARNARSNSDSNNLAELPELLLLAGGHPLWKEGSVIGAIGIAGGGSPENDDLIASKAGIVKAGISTKK